MTIERFKFTDYAELRLANGIGFEHWHLRGGIIPVLLAMENASFWTCREDGEVLAVGGCWPINDRICEVSFFPSERFVRSPLRVYRALRRGLRDLRGTFQRLQLNCRREEKFQAFARSLGFEEEGVLRGFGQDGCDHVMMAIVREP